MEERGDVRISFIHLVPETGKFIGIKVAGNESRLTGARRAGDPGHWILAEGIEMSKEPFSWKNPYRPRPGYFGNGNMLSGQGLPRILPSHFPPHLWEGGEGGGLSFTLLL